MAKVLDIDMNRIDTDMHEATEIWKKYQKGVDHHNRIGLYAKTRKAHSFFIGDQWAGLESGAEEIPIFNFLQPIVEHKVASVAMNGMAINYSPMEYGSEYEQATDACETLNKYAARQWELLKMDKLGWAIIRDACIAGDSYLYFYDKDLHAQVIDNTNIYFADETSDDLQGQPWVIIAERRFLADVRREAKQNGASAEEIEKIVSDDDTAQLLGDEAKKNMTQEELRCTSLLYMTKNDDGVVTISRSVRDVVYQQDTILQAKDEKSSELTGAGLTLYPIASLIWIKKKNSARGVGEILPLIPNQIETNKMLARRIVNAKITAFGRMVYNGDKVSNPESISKVGSAIKIKDIAAARVTDIVAYLHPSPMSPDAKNLSDELISQTRDLAGAGDAAIGQINPEKASGAAIIAVRDQAALPLNEQIADYKQFCEDVAAIWFAMWGVYNPQGMDIELPQDRKETQLQAHEQQTSAQPQIKKIAPEMLNDMRINIRIDVSPTNPYSKFAQEQSLGALMQAGAITFEEYVEALDENASTPKQKLQEIIEKRKQLEEQQRIMQENSNAAKLQSAMNIIQQQQGIIGSYDAPDGSAEEPSELIAPPQGEMAMEPQQMQ